MKTHSTSHVEEIGRLKKIEGQIKGIQRMIEERRYCLEILTQLSSVVGAIKKVEENILNRHLRTCVKDSFAERGQNDRERKIDEIIEVLRKFRKYG